MRAASDSAVVVSDSSLAELALSYRQRVVDVKSRPEVRLTVIKSSGYEGVLLEAKRIKPRYPTRSLKTIEMPSFDR